MIELNENTSSMVQLTGTAINGLCESLESLEAWACADDPQMMIAVGYQMREKLDYIMSMAAKRALS